MSETKQHAPKYPGTWQNTFNGMTIRDDFAKEALRWILPSDAWEDYDDVAQSAYAVADALMRARDTDRDAPPRGGKRKGRKK